MRYLIISLFLILVILDINELFYFWEFRTTENDEPKVAMLHFFGSIEPESTTHYIRGLNVIVHLQKSCKIMWPHLLFSHEKRSWLIAIPVEDEAIDFEADGIDNNNIYDSGNLNLFQNEFFKLLFHNRIHLIDFRCQC